MKIKINTTVHVDPVKWVLNRYGTTVKSDRNVQCRKLASEIREGCLRAIDEYLEQYDPSGASNEN